MAITIKKKKYSPAEEIKTQPVQTKPINESTRMIDDLKRQVSELGLQVSELKDKRQPVDVVATIQRDSEGRMNSILIKSNPL